MAWFWKKWGNKKIEPKKKEKQEDINNLEFIEKMKERIESSGKSRAEIILDSIEDQMKSLIRDKGDIEQKHKHSLSNFDKKIEEIQSQNQREIEKIREERDKQARLLEADRKQANNLEHKMLLLWDYWRREVEILKLERAINSGVAPTQRGILMKEIEKLNDENIVLEQGFKERKIEATVIEKLKGKLGSWQGFSNVRDVEEDKEKGINKKK